jgi:hypothetical protein
LVCGRSASSKYVRKGDGAEGSWSSLAGVTHLAQRALTYGEGRQAYKRDRERAGGAKEEAGKDR